MRDLHTYGSITKIYCCLSCIFTEPASADSSIKLYVSQFLFLILAYIEEKEQRTSTSLICVLLSVRPIRSMTWKNLLSLLIMDMAVTADVLLYNWQLTTEMAK